MTELSDGQVMVIAAIAFVTLLIAGAPVAINIGIAGLVGLVLLGEPLSVSGQLVKEAMGQTGLLAIPFYVFAGVALERSGVGHALLDFVLALVGHIRGAIIGVTGFASVIFGGISGSGPADAAALSSIFGPAMTRRGFPLRFAGAFCAAGGTLGLIVPPSAGYILYAILGGNATIPDLFLGGIAPGVLLAVGFVAAGLLSGRKYDRPDPQRAPARRVLRTLPGGLVGIGAPVIILAGIYTGTFTVIEAAGVGVVYAVAAGRLVFGRLPLREWPSLCIATGVATGTIFLIVAAAAMFRYLVTITGSAAAFSDWVVGLVGTPTGYLLATSAIVLLFGLLIDGVSMYFLLLPLFLPGVVAFGIDPVVYGVVFTVAVALGLITPPLGVDLFTVATVLDIELHEVVREVKYLILAGVAVLLLVIFVPAIVTWPLE